MISFISTAPFHLTPGRAFVSLRFWEAWVVADGGAGSVALSQETWTVAQMPPLTSCLILNKSLCLSRLIFFICQVKWRLWNRWSLKILPALQFYSGSVCTCRQWCGGGKGTGEGGKFSQGNKTLLPGAAPCPHVLCSTGLPQIIQIIDRVLAFLCQWTHCFRFSGSSSCFSEISIPSFRPPLCPLRNLSWFFWMDAHRILIQSKKKKKKFPCKSICNMTILLCLW